MLFAHRQQLEAKGRNSMIKDCRVEKRTKDFVIALIQLYYQFGKLNTMSMLHIKRSPQEA